MENIAAALRVDADDYSEQTNQYFSTDEGVSGVVSVGGTRDESTLSRTSFTQPFVGLYCFYHFHTFFYSAEVSCM